MRVSTLLSFLFFLISLGIYFLVIDPMLESNRWVAFVIFSLIFLSYSSLDKMLQGRFEFLDKRIDTQISVWIVFGLLIFAPLLIGALE